MEEILITINVTEKLSIGGGQDWLKTFCEMEMADAVFGQTGKFGPHLWVEGRDKLGKIQFMELQN